MADAAAERRVLIKPQGAFDRAKAAPVPAQREALPPVIRALLRPGAYAHRADDLRLHETHTSWVILAGRYAYKIKKPVNFGFLDFSTVESRLADCREEVRLNRRLCPDVYLGVVEVVERNGGYFVGGPGQPIEPAVRMRRLPEDGMLSNLLAEDAVDRRLVRRIARHLARFHSEAATGPGVDEYGSPATVRANWRENFVQMAPFVGRTISAATNKVIRAYVEDFLAEQVTRLKQRVAAGRIREGHGDLHAGSVCVDDHRLQLFDCLEFNLRLRCADAAADVAFLAMDLDHWGHADLADAFVDAYVGASGDGELRAVLNFYKCYRAYVRGKVLNLRLAQRGLSSEQEAALVDEARGYFDLAWAYAGGLACPTLVVTMGLPGSGKTTLARALAGRLGLVCLSSDVVRKELVGLKPTERRREGFEQGLYSPAMKLRTYSTLRRRAARWLHRGRSVVLDATFGQAGERAAVRRLAARTGARLVVLVCRADEATLRARLASRERDARTASDARLELWPALREAYDEPVEMPEAVAVDTAAPLAETVRQALGILQG